MLGTSYLVYHKRYTLRMLYASRGLGKVRHGWMISMVKTNHLSVDVHQHPHIRIRYIFFSKTCAIFALLSYKLILSNYFTNNLYALPYRSQTPDNDLAYSWWPFVV